MTIDDAYKLLGLEPALEFEAKQLAALATQPPPANVDPHHVLLAHPPVRAIGTTTRMLVMVALDAVEGKRVMLRLPTKEMQRQMRGEVSRFIRTLGGSQKEVDRVDVVLTPQRVTLNGEREYFDHWRDPLENIDRRIPGPLGWAYRANDVGRSYLVYDREGVLLAEVTRAGLIDLEESHCVKLERR
jgi:hypothetical protein